MTSYHLSQLECVNLGRALDHIHAPHLASALKLSRGLEVVVKQGRYTSHFPHGLTSLDLTLSHRACQHKACRGIKGLCAHSGAIALALLKGLNTYDQVRSPRLERFNPGFDIERMVASQGHAPEGYWPLEGFIMRTTLSSILWARPGDAGVWMPKHVMLVDATSVKPKSPYARLFVASWWLKAHPSLSYMVTSAAQAA